MADEACEKIKPINSGIATIKTEFRAKLQLNNQENEKTKNDHKLYRKAYMIKENMCLTFLREGTCDRNGGCKYSHDVDAYLRTKQTPIDSPCINMRIFGKCSYGVTCHFRHDIETNIELIDQSDQESNIIPFSVLRSLWKKEYNFKNTSKREGILNLDFGNKLYLAPLTTVGNLPFRRICKDFGADITCSEMALATSLLQGKKSEWALVKRHKSEDIFGIQIAGSNSESLRKCVKLLCDTTDADFIDLNMGCPIDLLYSKGIGCVLMSNAKRVINIVSSMVQESSVPITVKMRTGIKDGINLAHELLPQLKKIGVHSSTLHGRSREQRYTRLADWKYIGDCVECCDLPLIGNGDIYSYQDYVESTEYKTRGIMIGRGALIKPWIFKEIKEKQLYDISSKERLEIIKKYCDYGLEHWGTDIQGIEKTRRFLLEWLSFLCRYVPVGLLEHPPQKINQRPEPFIGRDDLEILLSSPKIEDWLKITSMFLGPPPEGFSFTPKHKSSAYG